MNVESIRTLYAYNRWANHRILMRAEEVTAEQLSMPQPFPAGNLFATLVHTLSAERGWLRRWHGDSPKTTLQASDFDGLPALRAMWAEEEQRMQAFLDTLDQEKLDTRMAYTTTKGMTGEEILWRMMAHVVNHGTQHRTEAAAMLTGFGHSPGDIDFIIYLRQL